MNASLPRFFKSVYRKEPISSFLLTIGVVDAVMGGFDDSWSLLLFGLGTIGVAIALRLWLLQQRRPEEPPEPAAPQRYLPYRSSRPVLPTITTSNKQKRE